LTDLSPGEIVALVPWHGIDAQTGWAMVVTMSRPRWLRMKGPAPSDRNAIPEGSH
jgi:hypothetical protein